MSLIPFDNNSEIKKEEELKGYSSLLQSIETSIKRKENIQIVGRRRFGKTSTLNVLVRKLKKDKSATVYPVYIDFKAEGIISNTIEVYKVIIENIICEYYKAELIDRELVFRKIKINADEEISEIKKQINLLEEADISSLLSNVIKKVSVSSGKTILLLIDEYEYLFKTSFEQGSGFMKLRELSTKEDDDTRLRYLEIVVAGATLWPEMSSSVGSPELNIINEEPTIVGMSYGNFEKFWNDECMLETDLSKRELVLSFMEEAYKKSGGIPFYAKIIGSQLLKTGEFPSYTTCENFLEEAFLSDTKEYEVINAVVFKTDIVDKKRLDYLIEKRIISNENNELKITIGYLEDLILSKGKEINNSISNTEKLVSQITKLIENINTTSKNKSDNGVDGYIFKPVNDSASQEEDLRALCNAEYQFCRFINSMYKMYFERSKGKVNGEKLPKEPEDFKNNTFAQLVDIMRHMYGGHEPDVFDTRKDQMTYPEALQKILGSKNKPHTSEQFLKMQIVLLSMFVKNLNELLAFVETER